MTVAAGNHQLDGAALARAKAGRGAITSLNLALADLDSAQRKAVSAGWNRQADRLEGLIGTATAILHQMQERSAT